MTKTTLRVYLNENPLAMAPWVGGQDDDPLHLAMVCDLPADDCSVDSVWRVLNSSWGPLREVPVYDGLQLNGWEWYGPNGVHWLALGNGWRARRNRSLSMGDVVQIGLDIWRCESVGWSRVDPDVLVAHA